MQTSGDAGRSARLDERLRRHVEAGELPGYHVAVLRQGEVIHESWHGLGCVREAKAVEPDMIWRIYSMTKPVAALAALMLVEEGLFDLNDPLGAYLPEFAGGQVWAGGTRDNPRLEPAEPIRIWHLLTHTAGLTFAMAADHPVDALYRRDGLDWAGLQQKSLAEACQRIARLPLLFQPGSAWSYSVALDVIGRLVEVVTGQEFGHFLAERIFRPLGMVDTDFFVPAEKAERLVSLHRLEPGQALTTLDEAGARILARPCGAYGGAGLVSTMADYIRFIRMLMGGGQLDGTQLVSPVMLALARANHLPGGAQLHDFGRPLLGAREGPGAGFGLLGSVIVDPVAAKVVAGKGTYGWSGAAGNWFWVDPENDLACIFMTQVMTTERSMIQANTRALIYGAFA